MERWRYNKARKYKLAEEDKKPEGPRLNLGCGGDVRDPLDGWVNVDKYPKHPDVMRWDIEKGYLPFDDDHFGYVLAIDFFEHIPHRSPAQEKDGELFMALIGDLIRVSKAGAKWLIITPARPSSLNGPGHCRLVTEGTWDIFRLDKSSGEVPVAQEHGRLVLVKVVNMRQWTPNIYFGRTMDKAQTLRVVK